MTKTKYTSEELLKNLPIKKSITTLAIPSIMAMLVMSIFNFVDTLYIGMLDNSLALSAVGVAYPIMTLKAAIGQTLGAGAAAAIGRCFGSKQGDLASKTCTTIIYTSIIVGIIFTAIGIIFTKEIFTVFGASEASMPYALDYGKWMFAGAAFTVPNMSFNNIARAETKAKLSMNALIIGSVANIILDPIFMFTFNMGIKGAAIATTISQGITFVCIAWYFFLGKSRAKVKLEFFKPSKKIFAEVLKSGAPTGASQILNTISVIVTNLVIGTIAVNTVQSDNLIAAYGVVLKIILMIQFTLMGFLQGYQPIASYCFGAKNKERFYGAVKFVFKLVLIYTVICTIGVQIFSDELLRLFSNEPEILNYGATLLSCNNMFFVLIGITQMIMITFQAIGNGKGGVLISVIRQGAFYMVFLFVLPKFLGLNALYVSQPIADVLTFVLAIILALKCIKSLKVHFTNEELEVKTVE